MKQSFLVAIATNKHRYWFGSGLFIALLVIVMIAAFSIQSGVTIKEQQSAVTSATLSLSSDSLKHIVDLPYHLIQKISLHIFDITPLGIKFPSFLAGIAIGLMLLGLLKSWLLRANIALFTSLIAITNSQFINTIATGTPLVMMIVWSMAIFLFGLLFVKKPTSLARLLLLFSIIGLGLYTPLTIYVVIALCVLTILHPHLRYIVKSISLKNKFITAIVTLGLLTPLIMGIWIEPRQLLALLGIPPLHISGGYLRHSIGDIIKLYFVFWYGNITAIGISPVFNMASLCLIIFGGLRLIANIHAARSYGLLLLFPTLLLPVILQPQYAVILFVPLILLLAIGVEGLLDEWYKLFPHNPYARVTALLPTTVLLASIIISNITFYSNVMQYNENVSRYYTNDLTLLRPLLEKYPKSTLITSDLEYSFYDLLRRDFPDVSVSSSENFKSVHKPYIITPGSGIITDQLGTPTRIATDSFKERTPRFYVYADQN